MSAPRVFTKVMPPIVAVAREEGIFVFPYLDDWILRYQLRTILPKMLTRLLEIWDWCRLIRNIPKSHTDPTQSLVFDKGHFQTQKNIVSLPEERLESLKEGLRPFKVDTIVTARQFLSLLGTMAAMMEVVKHCRLHMRPIQIYLMAFWKPSSRKLEARIPVREHLIPHLAWWKNRENVMQGLPLRKDKHQMTITTDAFSTQGWGDMQVQGKWDFNEKSQHINMLEMEAVIRTCRHFRDFIQGKRLLVRSDNATVVSYLNKEGGTRAPSICMITWRFLKWVIQKKVDIRAEHVPGIQNSLADRLSREFVSPLEWRLHPGVI